MVGDGSWCAGDTSSLEACRGPSVKPAGGTASPSFGSQARLRVTVRRPLLSATTSIRNLTTVRCEQRLWDPASDRLRAVIRGGTRCRVNGKEVISAEQQQAVPLRKKG